MIKVPRPDEHPGEGACFLRVSLLQFTEEGIFCPKAQVHIDPWRRVERALITHGHSDHARWGHRSYLCTDLAAPVIRYRLGDIQLQTIAYGETVTLNGVKFSFHPAGHIPGSAQIRVEYKGEVWVVSGDYKLEDDGLSTPFEPITCHSFITECTFGLPVYKWESQEEVMQDINDWWRANADSGKVSVISAYALGKAQRVLQGLDESIGPIFTHGAVENTNRVMRKQGIALKKTTRVSTEHKRQDFEKAMVIAPPSALGSPWMKRFGPTSTGIASGWMTLRGARRRRAADRGFVLSDHADWPGLNQAIRETGAEKVFVTHGYTDIFRKWLEEEGYEAHVVSTEYGEEDSEEMNKEE